jgi:hypothetical protein
MSVSNSADNVRLVSRNAVGEEFAKALRLYVGRGRRYSVKQLSNATGVPDRLIETYMTNPESTEARKIALEDVLSIATFLGAEFTNEWLPKLARQVASDVPNDDGSEEVLDDLAEAAAEVEAEVRRARHPKSPGGPKIVPIERNAIKARGRKLCAMARAVA